MAIILFYKHLSLPGVSQPRLSPRIRCFMSIRTPEEEEEDVYKTPGSLGWLVLVVVFDRYFSALATSQSLHPNPNTLPTL
jgi:hypothetical protein